MCHPFWTQDVMCRSCCLQRTACMTCERHVIPRQDPRRICQQCASLGRITSATALDVLLRHALSVLTHATGISLERLYPHLVVRFGTRAQLRAAAGKARSGHLQHECAATTTFGICYYDASRTKTRASPSLQIIILNVLSPLLVGAFLSHELMHALLFSLCHHQPLWGPTLPTSTAQLQLPDMSLSLLEEGLCHVAAACWLALHATPSRYSQLSQHLRRLLSPSSLAYRDQVHFWLRKFFYGRHPEFSVGFHTARRLLQQCGWPAVCKALATRAVAP